MISEVGFIYHELLKINDTKAKGVGSEDFCLFLSSLASRLPQDSIIIMENAPNHCGEQSFLNPIKCSFHSIKSFVQGKEPESQVELVQQIKTGIEEAITPEKKLGFFFSHVQKYFRNCLEMQPITGPLLANPKFG